jgi:hypothetical protein
MLRSSEENVIEIFYCKLARFMIVENFPNWFGTVQFTHKYLYRIGLVYTSGFRLRFRQATSFSARLNVKIYYCGTFPSL